MLLNLPGRGPNHFLSFIYQVSRLNTRTRYTSNLVRDVVPEQRSRPRCQIAWYSDRSVTHRIHTGALNSLVGRLGPESSKTLCVHGSQARKHRRLIAQSELCKRTERKDSWGIETKFDAEASQTSLFDQNSYCFDSGRTANRSDSTEIPLLFPAPYRSCPSLSHSYQMQHLAWVRPS